MLIPFGALIFNIFCIGLGDNVNRNDPTLLPMNAKFVSCGYSHTMLIDLEDNVYSFGNNKDRQLGLGDNQDRNEPTLLPIKAKSVSCGSCRSMIIT